MDLITETQFIEAITQANSVVECCELLGNINYRTYRRYLDLYKVYDLHREMKSYLYDGYT